VVPAFGIDKVVRVAIDLNAVPPSFVDRRDLDGFVDDFLRAVRQGAMCSGNACIPLPTELPYFPNTESVAAVEGTTVPTTQPGERRAPERDADILRSAVANIQGRLPAGWSIGRPDLSQRRRGIDATLKVTGPDRQTAILAVDVKRSVVTGDLPGLVEQLRLSVDQLAEPAALLLAAAYLGNSAQQWLQERGISYVDATGNVFLVLNRPGLFLRDRGADRDPWRGPGRPRSSLQGPPAARVVRALVDFFPPVTVRELVRRSNASTGATYRAIEFLEREGLLERDARGPIYHVQWRRLIERWSEDYGFQRNNAIGTYVYPRGLSALVDRLASASVPPYAVTGSLAAQRMAPYADPRVAMIYVDEPEQFAADLTLRAVDSGANVLLATGEYDVAFDRVVEADGLTYAAPSQTAVDLLTGPGRSLAEGQALLDWMESNESAWRI